MIEGHFGSVPGSEIAHLLGACKDLTKQKTFCLMKKGKLLNQSLNVYHLGGLKVCCPRKVRCLDPLKSPEMCTYLFIFACSNF